MRTVHAIAAVAALALAACGEIIGATSDTSPDGSAPDVPTAADAGDASTTDADASADAPADRGCVPGPTNKLVFLSDPWPSVSGGVAGADGLCAVSLANAGLCSRMMRAYIGTVASAPWERFAPTTGTWTRPDGTTAFTDLAAGPISVIDQTAGGAVVAVAQQAWTGSHGPGGGLVNASDTCQDWTMARDVDMGITGSPASMTKSAWFDDGKHETCSTANLRVICVEP